VLAASQAPTGTAVDVAPDNFAHPVYRSGFALALKLPMAKAASDFAPVETPTDEEALEPPPCKEVPAMLAEEGPEAVEEWSPETLPVEDVTRENVPDESGTGSVEAAPSLEETEERPPDEL